jgi:hypothetical protein
VSPLSPSNSGFSSTDFKERKMCFEVVNLVDVSEMLISSELSCYSFTFELAI